jgi:REP element-mobilizing transposase RayT
MQAKDQADTLSFVIMPNHLHLLLHLRNDNINLNSLIGNGKRFMAYEIVKRLKDQNNGQMLSRLVEACSEKEKSKGQKHKAFNPSFDAKPIYTEEFFYQKFNYIHHNPVMGKWNLSEDYIKYYHSSAAFYETGLVHELLKITDYRDVV